MGKGIDLTKKDIHNILLIQLGDIGDVVLSFPCIRALRENFPKATIIVAVREKARELIEDCPWSTGVISVNKEKRSLGQEIEYQKNFLLGLRRFRFDLVIDMRTGTRGAILTLLTGARYRVGYRGDGKGWRNRIFNHLASDEYVPRQYVGDYYFRLLMTYGFRTEDVRPELRVPRERRKRAAALLKEHGVLLDQPLIVVQPFSLWHYKEWGIDKYIQLINWIGIKYRFPVVLTGSSAERGRIVEIIKRCKENVYNLAGETSIGAFSAILGYCRLFIGVDSSGMHISGAVGTPTVTIFGPSSPVSWAPRGEKHVVVQKDFSCVPCRRKGCDDSEVSRCLEELTVEEVSSAVERQLYHRQPSSERG
ncbi:MAG: glycosyltransferase family 9 protein [Pseudomonadota bacterium]